MGLRSGSFDGDNGVTCESAIGRSIKTGSYRHSGSFNDDDDENESNDHRSRRLRGSPTNRRGGSRSSDNSFCRDDDDDVGYGSIINSEDGRRRRRSLKLDDDDDDDDDDAERKPLFLLRGHDDASSSRSTSPTASHPPRIQQLPDLFLKDEELLHDEIAGIANLAIPTIFTYLLDLIPDILTIVLVGRVAHVVDEAEGGGGGGGGEGETSDLQKLHMDAAALAIMFINVVTISPGFGILTALDTLCSQAFGAGQYSKIGNYSVTALAVLSVFYVFGSVVIWNASSILIALGQPEEVAYFVGMFLLFRLPGIPFLYIEELIGTVFASRNNAIPVLVATVWYNVVSLGLGCYLVRWTEWGWLGAAVARTVADMLTVPAILLSAIAFPGAGEFDDSSDLSKNEDELDPQGYSEVDSSAGDEVEFDSQGHSEAENLLHYMWKGLVVGEALSAKAIIKFLQLGIPGMLQVMFEWVAFEVLALLCGILPGKEAIIGIGANSIVCNITMLAYMPYMGASAAATIRIGNALGAGDVHRAKVASNLALACAATMSIINTMILLSFRNVLPWLFTTDLDIVQKAEHVLLIVAMYQFPDAINACAQGIFRGSGRQALSAKFNFVAFYIIGLPLGYILGITLNLGVEGLWLGMTLGLICVTLAGAIVILRSNWEELAAEAALRLDDEEW